MAKHAAGPDHPAFRITDADRDHPARHRKQDRTGKAGKPKLSLVLTDVITPQEVAKAS